MSAYIFTAQDIAPFDEYFARRGTVPPSELDELAAACIAKLDDLIPLPVDVAAASSASLASRAAIGFAIREARLGKGMSQDALGTVAGFDAAAISRIEHGRKSIDPTRLALLAAHLGIVL